MTDKNKNSNYEALAYIYDEVMQDIDYEDWADYIDELIQEHHPDAVSVLELACGTGRLALSLDELDCYDITATDRSEAMLNVGRLRAEYLKSSIRWEIIDFFDIRLSETYDVVMTLFDSLNYILEDTRILDVFSQAYKVLNEGGLFIFDFTTPAHSEKYAEKMNDQGVTPDNYRFVRRSYYLPAEKLHYNEFDIEKLSTDHGEVLERYREVHRQRAYKLTEMKQLIDKTEFELLAAYDDFDVSEATDSSSRITVVLRK
ncbi:MAG: class I SAM-dependent DNA methyltransferase [Cyclonatronaceae bacterium]